MYRVLAVMLTFHYAFPFFAGVALAGTPDAVRKPFGIEKRVPWTTSKIHGTPNPPSPYRTEIVFPNVRFSEPLEITAVPAAGRLAVAERQGKIFTFATTEPKKSKRELLIDVGRTVYGLAFHPRFAENGFFYVTEVVDPKNPGPEDSHLVRYQAKDPARPIAEAASAKLLLRWPSGGHNGGCLQFGPDGMLYLATGDGSGIADGLETGQDISDLLGSILRIDVDREEDGRAYAIPDDNPFVGIAGARGEVWAYGLRQAWKFSFDRAGRLWAGEIGQDLWESIHLIERGGNYGWSVMEGTHPFRPQRKKGPTPILKPLVEHPHSEARSIVGGHFYRGSRLPELRGAYIYGDYDTGKIWSLRYDGGEVRDQLELADTQLRIIDFVQDGSGEVLLLDFIGGAIHRLVATPPSTGEQAKFPRKLSETGLFASTKDHKPAPGLIPYSVNAPLWSDGALKTRFLALPGNAQIEFDAVVYPNPPPGAPPGWRFPPETVLVKTFSMEMEAGNPDSVRRLETRILHYKYMPGTDEIGAQFWRGYTYVWNDAQTDAELLGAEGLSREITIRDTKAAGGKRRLVYRFPSRTECTLCHNMSAKYALGVDTLQMNKDHDYGGVIANQLATLEHLGVFTEPLPAPPEKLPSLVNYEDDTYSLDHRARAYLHSNCAHCHRKWGGGNADFQLLWTLPLAETGAIGVRPGQGTFGLEDPRLVVPGKPERSMIYHRMTRLGLGRMPHIASNVVDENAVRLVREWIASMPSK